MRLSDFFIRVLCIASVLLYTASATLIANPQARISQNLILRISKLQDGTTSKFVPSTVKEEFLITKVIAKLNSLENLFKIIGYHTLPLNLIIDADHPTRVSVGALDLIVGSRAVLANGQLEHALLKAWIMQKGSSQVLMNPLRVEVGADLLLATYNGKLNLTDPENSKAATFSDLQSWTHDLLGEVELCNSAWKPAELISYCRGLVEKKTAIASFPYSLRKVIGSLVWKDISKESLFKREESLKVIARSLQQGELPTQEPNSLQSLIAKIENEAREVYPNLRSTLSQPDLSVVLKRDEKSLLLSGFEVQESEVANASRVIVESCTAPSVSDLLKITNEKSEHILWVQTCGETQIRYEGFAIEGIKKFARENRAVKFAYLHRESLKLASKMLNNFDVVTALNLEANTKDAKFLGLDQKVFRQDINAFKVNGPIGAIEWFRLSANANESRS